MLNDSKQLILGLVSKLSLEQVKPFFWSLEKTGYRGDICMVVGESGAATQSFLRARRVQLVPFQKAFLRGFSAWSARLPRAVLSSRRSAAFNRQLAPAYMHPRCARYFFYLLYLQECGGNYSHVMLSDVRDVLFQARPFAHDVPDGLSVFLEEPGSGAAGTNSRGHRPAVATGVIMGTTAAIRAHLTCMTNTLCKQGGRGPIDKAVHNSLLSQDPPPKLRCFENFSGPVLNLAGLNPSEIQISAQNQILSSSGKVVSVLHQYDRHPDLAQKLLIGQL